MKYISKFNKSIKNCLEIARTYGYKVEVITIYRAPQHRAILSVYDNSFRSPYPSHFTSNIANYDYITTMVNNYFE